MVDLGGDPRKYWAGSGEVRRLKVCYQGRTLLHHRTLGHWAPSCRAALGDSAGKSQSYPTPTSWTPRIHSFQALLFIPAYKHLALMTRGNPQALAVRPSQEQQGVRAGREPLLHLPSLPCSLSCVTLKKGQPESEEETTSMGPDSTCNATHTGLEGLCPVLPGRHL